MKHTSGCQARLAGITLAVAATFAGLGSGAAQADPAFTGASITINSVGFLNCSFKETGLPPGATVDYTCEATDVGWVTQCFVRSKPVANLPVALHVAHAADGLVTTQPRTVSRQGTVSSSVLTAYPTAEAEPVNPLCPETEGVTITEEITAIRWCNSKLTDTTNGILGASEPALFLQLVRNGSSAVPDCATLNGLPSDLLGTPTK